MLPAQAATVMVADGGAPNSPGSEAQSAASGATAKLKWHQKFARQQFQGWRPILNVSSAQIFFVSAGIFCIALGIPILTASLTVINYEARYDDTGAFQGLSNDAAQALMWQNAAAPNGVPLEVEIAVDSDMEPPVYVFYRLGSFFQNYRRYVRSYDSSQMHNGGAGAGAAACEPFQYQNFEANASLPNNGAITPCGQIAYSNFNDSYTMQLVAPGGAVSTIALDESNLAWSSDQNHLYGPVQAENYNVDPDFRGGATTTQPLNQAQHWMVWMRPGGSVAVSKLYAQINQKIPAGSKVRVQVANRYNMYAFGGSKSVILTTNSWVGGRNNFLGACYITVGGLSLLLALAFFLAYNTGLVEKRRYGDLGELSWLKKYDGTIRPSLRVSPTNHLQGAAQDGQQSEGKRPKNT